MTQRSGPAHERRIRSGDAWFAAVCAYLDKHAHKELLPAGRLGPADPDMRADGVGVGIKRWKHATDDDPFQLVFATSRDRRLVLLMLNNGDANRLFAVLVSALVDAMTCQWHPYPYRSVRTDSDYLAGHGLGALLCVHPNAVGALARVALHPRTPALRGATIVKLMAITDQEHALARKDVDALLDDFQARGRDRMTVKQPFFLPPA